MSQRIGDKLSHHHQHGATTMVRAVGSSPLTPTSASSSLQARPGARRQTRRACGEPKQLLVSNTACASRGRAKRPTRMVGTVTYSTVLLSLALSLLLLLGELQEAAAHAPWGGRRRRTTRVAISTAAVSGSDAWLVSEVAFRSTTDTTTSTTTTADQQQQQLDPDVPSSLLLPKQHRGEKARSTKQKRKRNRTAATTTQEPPSPPRRHKKKKKRSAVRQYHDAIQFLIPQETSVSEQPSPSSSTYRGRRTPFQQQQQPTTTSTDEGRDHKKHKHLPATRIGVLAQYFRPVLRTNHHHHGDNDNNDLLIIDMPHLLDACHRFEKAMVAVGQTLAAKDLRNNLAKVEAFCKKQHKHDHHGHNDMRTILQLEQATHVHSTGPHGFPLLAEDSCAMGLLWIRRSLQFQSRFYSNLLVDATVDPKHAALQAYAETLQAVHGWTLQKIHVLAFKTAAASDRRALLARLGGFDNANDSKDFGAAQEEAVQRDLRALVDLWEPLLQRWEDIFDELDLEDPRRV